MPIPIVQHSANLCNFLLPLLVGLNAFQQRHVFNVVDVLLAGTGKHKVLTAVTRMLLVEHADYFALADFLRRSPWDAERRITDIVNTGYPSTSISVSSAVNSSQPSLHLHLEHLC